MPTSRDRITARCPSFLNKSMLRCIKWVLIILLALVLALAGVVYIFLVEPRRLVTEEVEVALNGWPQEADAVKVAVLTDLHASAHEEKWLARLVECIGEAKPEAVILLGDYFNALNPESAITPQQLAEQLAPLANTCKVYYVCGNHDRGDIARQLRRCFKQKGFVCIENRDEEVAFSNGQKLILRGASHMPEASPGTHPYFGPWYKHRFGRNKLPLHTPLLAAVHSPYYFFKEELWADFAVAGHTHGGQICLPGGEPLRADDLWSKENTRAGMHRCKNNTPLYISRGVGLSRVPLRLFCPPELSILVLKGTGRPLPHRAVSAP